MLLMGTSGPFGKYITLPAPLTIAIRSILALVFLYAYCRFKGISFRLRKADMAPIFLSGVLMGVHWITYFEALQLSNVAIGMLALFTYPVFTAFLEPVFLKTRFQKIHLFLGALVLSGVYLLAPDIDFGNSHTVAIAFGLFSAVCYALRNLIVKTKVGNYQGSVLMSYQLLLVSVLLIPTFFIYDLTEVPGQWKGLLGVALVTTALGHTLLINTFKHFSVTTISIISSVQPIYGIVIGALFLSEIPSWPTIIGGALILASVVIESVRAYRR